MPDPKGASASDSGHRVTEEWMGEAVETLADLLKPGLRAVCVGINPAPESVRVGHYYQGRLGQAFLTRLRRIRLVRIDTHGWEDDVAFANGIGFTDIVKRPTPSEADVRADEYDYGRPLLAAKLEDVRPGLVIFSFKKAAERFFGPFSGNGFVPGLRIGRADVFVMPGPYERRENVDSRLAELTLRVPKG
jgi:TDG/mug DNA glycosylase family protein